MIATVACVFGVLVFLYVAPIFDTFAGGAAAALGVFFLVLDVLGPAVARVVRTFGGGG